MRNRRCMKRRLVRRRRLYSWCICAELHGFNYVRISEPPEDEQVVYSDVGKYELCNYMLREHTAWSTERHVEAKMIIQGTRSTIYCVETSTPDGIPLSRVATAFTIIPSCHTIPTAKLRPSPRTERSSNPEQKCTRHQSACH